MIPEAIKAQLATMTPWQRVRFRLAYWELLPGLVPRIATAKRSCSGKRQRRKAAENQGLLANEIYLELLG